MAWDTEGTRRAFVIHAAERQVTPVTEPAAIGYTGRPE